MKESKKVEFDEGVRRDWDQRIEAVKSAIKSGEMPFKNPPPEWTDELLISTAQKLVLAHLDSNAKLN